MRKPVFLVVGLLLGATPALGDQVVTAAKAPQAPVIDGVSDDAAWARAEAVSVRDPVAGIPITLKSVHTGSEVFFLVTYPDETESREHKTMVWDGAAGRYRVGPKREDALVLKWNLEPHPVDLTLSSSLPYKADTWFWKANRTDHAGFADDKLQIYSLHSRPRAKKMLSKNGRIFYLTRQGDKGRPAYAAAIYDEYRGEEMPRFTYRTPEGSRADIRAKGIWSNGTWTIELGRRLDTGHSDDVRFRTDGRYAFGVSRYEVAGRKPNPELDPPHYGSGEVGEILTLVFE